LRSLIKLRGGLGIFKEYADSENLKLVLIVAGEASGDLHGSNLVRAMKSLDPGITFWGIGGSKMKDAGVNILKSSSDMAVVGLTEVFTRLYTIIRTHLKLKYILKTIHPELLILLDYPGFNINLARSAKRYKVPVLYYISPQVWAWRRGRVRKIARRVDRMAVILPFEKNFYVESDLVVEYVGHPLLDCIPHDLDRNKILMDMGLQDANPIVGLLPGSRDEEVRNLLPSMVQAGEILSARYPNLKCVLPLASTISLDFVQSIIRESSMEIAISQEDIYKTLMICDLVLVASGTATLEATIMEVPMIIVYRVSPISFWVAKMVLKVPYIGLVNLVAGEEVVPELIQDEVTPQRLVDEAIPILESGHEKWDMIRKLKMVKERLGEGGASEKTARMALEMIREDKYLLK
jgi:lipid-A-disaccharide synthase